MPKHQAQAIVETWKRWIVIVSLLSFGTLGGLILSNMPATSTNATNGTNATTTGNPLATPTAPSSTGGIFQQPQGGGGFGFGGQQGGNGGFGPVSHSSGS